MLTLLLSAKVNELIDLNLKKMKVNVKLVQINSELGAGTRGASGGFLGLLKAAISKKSTLFDKLESIIVPHANEVLEDTVVFQFAKRVTSLLAVFKGVSDSVRMVLKSKGGFPVVLAGDHSTAIGTISGVKAAFPNKKIGVIWIDAHADIHTPYTTPSGNMHGMPIAASLNLDNQRAEGNQPNSVVIDCWNKIKNLSGIAPKISANDIVYIGVRDTEWQEDQLIAEYNIKNFTVDEVRRIGMEQTVLSTLNILSNTDVIYISYDVDVLDPSQSRGTGTPVDNGFLLHEVKDMIGKLILEPKVKCFEIVEINPDLDDKGNKMAEMALEVLEIVVAAKS